MLCVILTGGAAEAPVWGLPQLMARMRSVPASTASFVELKQLRLLNQPLRTSGRLIYVAPDRLRKETIEPAPASLTIEGDRLTIEQPGDTTRTLSLRAYPEIGALSGAIRWTLAGDLAALSDAYTITLGGTARDWTLTLEPRDRRVRDLVTLIRLRGAGESILGVETFEAAGDRSAMTIAPAGH